MPTVDTDLTPEQRQSLMRYPAANLPIQRARPGYLRRRARTVTPQQVSQIIREQLPGTSLP